MVTWPQAFLGIVLGHAESLRLEKERITERGDYYDLRGDDGTTAQVHIMLDNVQDLALVIGYADESCREPEGLERVALGERPEDRRVLSGDCWANWTWLRADKNFGHLGHPARVYRLPAVMADRNHAGWNDVERLLEYATNR